MTQLSSNAQAINALTKSQRDNAYENARKQIAGDKPIQEEYMNGTYSMFPPNAQRGITFAINMVLLGAFIPSALRIFIAGSTSAIALGNGSVLEGWQQIALYVYALIVGGGAVLIAEAGQIAFTLASSASDNKTHKRSLIVASWLCTAFALLANIAVVKPYTHDFGDSFALAFAWCETLLPPILVLIAANVRKAQILQTVKDRYASQQSYQNATHEWTVRYHNADADTRFNRMLANALRNNLIDANKQSRARLRLLTNEDWYALINRERHAEEWYVDAPAIVVTMPQQPTLPTQNAQAINALTKSQPLPRAIGVSSGRATGELSGAVTKNEDSTYTYTCPVCQKSEVKGTYKSAMGALVAHTRHTHRS